MRFWDASALVPLIVPEASSSRMLERYREDASLWVWALTPVEIASALARRQREGLPEPSARQARMRLEAITGQWTEVTALEQVRERAVRLLNLHSLTAADALQLAAALVATEERPTGVGFVTLDEMLAQAAAKEGFAILS